MKSEFFLMVVFLSLLILASFENLGRANEVDPIAGAGKEFTGAL